ncbi:16S rRNA (cytosine(1407)-C(5))-methyltransferase RsmF [Shewanella submarina]|uniref:Ribosomal RNA small subunit methyltransferase F n=1 Tax=Shewanella submarina TaxID=2016376 RepID=A0ABV7GD14_9GAMM|nr:16S rRNA (cytosine(1407)-C(5))-methyltransferase RsmF [Shewanella submarina]MCL1037527.1 16S rRNA (cytosine(1407)-C(5))-methyltransferase RsmF [Shewanella submarina]
MVQLNPDFINSIQQDIPAHLSIDDFIEYCGKPLRPSIRVNTLSISSADFKALMEPRGWEFEPIPWCKDGFWLTGHNPEELGNCVEHIQGLFYIQEASSMLPPTALFDTEPQYDRVLDTASAPGSKTTQIAALMENRGLLVANEYSSSRVKVLHANIARMGARNTAITHFDGRVFGEYQFETFDAVLLDAPCSGEGTVRKDPDALKYWRQEDIDDIAETQRELMLSAFQALKPGGMLVYSTCTLNTQENQQVCHFLKETYPDAVEFISLANLFADADKATTVEGFLHVWPQIFDSEGFFVAAIRKTQAVERALPQPKPQKNFPFTHPTRKQTEAMKIHLNNLGFTLPETQSLMIRDAEYWLFPEGFDELIGSMRFQRIGLKLADEAKHGFKLRHEAVIALPCQQARVIELDEQQAVEYLMGRDVVFDGDKPAKGEVIVGRHGIPLGLAKSLPGKLKNSLPRELVRDKVCTA